MDLTQPFSVVTPTLDGSVLAALLTVHTVDSAAEIHRRAGTGTAHGVRKVLRRLVTEGVVDAVEHGGTSLYRLNREHIAYDAIVALASLHSALIDRLRRELGRWPDLLHASLPPFGPGNAMEVHYDVMRAARSTGRLYTRDPDADFSAPGVVRLVMVVEDDATVRTPQWRYAAEQLAGRVQTWTGNQTQLEIVTLDDLSRRASQRDPVLQQWWRTNVHLCGGELVELTNQL